MDAACFQRAVAEGGGERRLRGQRMAVGVAGFDGDVQAEGAWAGWSDLVSRGCWREHADEVRGGVDGRLERSVDSGGDEVGAVGRQERWRCEDGLAQAAPKGRLGV